MQYLAEPTAATLREDVDMHYHYKQNLGKPKKNFSVNVWSEVHVCLFVLPEFFDVFCFS